MHRITRLIISNFLFFLVGTSAIAAGVSTALTSAAAITAIFGVGGAGEHKNIDVISFIDVDSVQLRDRFSEL